MTRTVDLCVIGGGEAGFSVALAGVALGLTVVLADSGSADPCWRNWDVALAVLRRAGKRALADQSRPDRSDNLRRFRAELRVGLAAAAADLRFARLGATNVRILRERAQFEDPRTLRIGTETVRARRFVLATGLKQETAPSGTLLTLERLLGTADLPDHVAIEGGDARALALAQGLSRLGVDVVVNAPLGLLPGCDPELVAALRRSLDRDRVVVDGGSRPIDAASSWVYRSAAEAALPDLHPERAGIATQAGSLLLSPALRTTNARVYAVGGVAGARSAQATQAQVAVVIKAALFRLPVRYELTFVPECTITDPAIATVGRDETRAGQAVTVWRWPLAETMAGAATGADGHVKVTVDARGRVIGAGIVGPDAAEQIGFWTLAVQHRMSLLKLADTAAPVPSLAEASRRVALLRAGQRLQNAWLKRVAALLRPLG